ncbi:MAG: hypothetical protein K2O32_07605 [Acetatifactor sp.]|nr:hypothetical protein [Acetatifactor sp.]
MGTFATLFYKAEAEMPDEKMEEFRARIEKLFQMGGMMEMEQVQLCGKEALTIKKASMHDYGMDFYYNYFEDDCWENAGFCSESGNVWSDKIGWREFHQAVVAAYVLESLYIDGPAVVMVNGDLVTARAYIGWINYLFQTEYPQKNNDPWALFEALHDHTNMDLERCDWSEFIQDLYGVIGYFEITAVLKGTAALEKEYDKLAGYESRDEKDGSLNFFDFAKRLKIAVNKFYRENAEDETRQLSLIVEMLRSYYEQDGMALDISKKYEDKDLEAICFFAALTDAPAYVFQVLSEVYDVDFWELWERVKDVAKRKGILYEPEIPQETISVSTMDFFGVTADDLILFWDDDKNVQFSRELKIWFKDLKSRFDILMESGYVVENPLYWVLDLMEYADENYYQIYCFSDFFKETMEHLNDRRFWTLWKIYDEMLHDPVMEEAGSVVFVPEGPEYEHIGLHYYGTPPRRRLKTNWNMIKREERNNKARVTFRRYMALLENRKLRKEIFGF